LECSKLKHLISCALTFADFFETTSTELLDRSLYGRLKQEVAKKNATGKGSQLGTGQ